MEGQLRSTAGFLGGGGVTPSPTPPVVETVYYRYDSQNDVYFLCDSEGRALFTPIGERGQFFRCNSDGTFANFEVDNFNLAETYGVSEVFIEGDPESSWSFTCDGTNYTYNGVLTPSVSYLGLLYRPAEISNRGTNSLLVDAQGRVIKSQYGGVILCGAAANDVETAGLDVVVTDISGWGVSDIIANISTPYVNVQAYGVQWSAMYESSFSPSLKPFE